MKRAFKLHPCDNTAVLLDDAEYGDQISYEMQAVKAMQSIPKFHKIALEDMAAGELVMKYGYPIGKATTVIKRGSWVHVHNCESL